MNKKNKNITICLIIGSIISVPFIFISYLELTTFKIKGNVSKSNFTDEYTYYEKCIKDNTRFGGTKICYEAWYLFKRTFNLTIKNKEIVVFQEIKISYYFYLCHNLDLDTYFPDNAFLIKENEIYYLSGNIRKNGDLILKNVNQK